MERVRAHVFISGRVQGVNFRAYMRDRAREAGVEGWVRNLSDSRVEAIFEGTRPAVQRLVSWCYSGPVHAEVAKVELAWEDPTGKESSFAIIW
ncbi:MAG: acylphosphatase [Chloroflexales bacterium]